MPSIFRKLASLPRRLLCLPRRSDFDLADDLPVTTEKSQQAVTPDIVARRAKTAPEYPTETRPAIDGPEIAHVDPEEPQRSNETTPIHAPEGDKNMPGSTDDSSSLRVRLSLVRFRLSLAPVFDWRSSRCQSQFRCRSLPGLQLATP